LSTKNWGNEANSLEANDLKSEGRKNSLLNQAQDGKPGLLAVNSNGGH